MDVSPTDLEKLKCISCESYLSRGPVYLQHDGAAICGRCYAPMRPAIRNIQYETTAKYLRFPCKNLDLGCRETVPFVDEEEEIAHEEVCEHRQYICPVHDSARCDWLGSRQDILQHCTEEHPDKVVDNPTVLIHDISKSTVHTYLLRAFEVLFLLHTKVCLVSGKIFHSVRYLGASDEAKKYDFTLDIKRGIEQITKARQVAPQGCLVLQESASLVLDTNSLLSMLEGFDGTTFTVTVTRKDEQPTRHIEGLKEAVSCINCNSPVSSFRYRDEGGWRCERCAPARRPCDNQGCSYTDIEKKIQKHEWYFCQQRTHCLICSLALLRGTLSSHYASLHVGDTHVAGSTWRATRTGGAVRRCLLSTAAGMGLCAYWLDSAQLALLVYLPVPSDRLGEVRCVVRITNPQTGRTRADAPDVRYCERWDWNVVVKKKDFLEWNTEFDVAVDIIV